MKQVRESYLNNCSVEFALQLMKILDGKNTTYFVENGKIYYTVEVTTDEG